MAQLALEEAMQSIARNAREFAERPHVANLSGPNALLAFASAIESTNATVWPKPDAKS